MVSWLLLTATAGQETCQQALEAHVDIFKCAGETLGSIILHLRVFALAGFCGKCRALYVYSNLLFTFLCYMDINRLPHAIGP